MFVVLTDVVLCLDRFLREKTAADDDFPELCKLRRGAAKHSLPSLLDLPVSIPSNLHYLVSGNVM